MKIDSSKKSLYCEGWQISDHEEDVFKLTLDGVELDGVRRKNRQDVFDAYQEAYAGDMDPDTIGWEITIDLTGLEPGNHRLQVQCLEPNGNILAEKSIQIIIE